MEEVRKAENRLYQWLNLILIGGVFVSVLSNACTIKIENFEGFDLFHLIENKIDIYDIPIDDITDQYMDYLFKCRKWI